MLYACGRQVGTPRHTLSGKAGLLPGAMANERSLFDKISELNAGGKPSVAHCVEWLREQGLTREGHSLQPDPARDPSGLLDAHNRTTLGVPSHRRQAWRMRKPERDLLQKRYRDEHAKPQFSCGSKSIRRFWSTAGAKSLPDIAVPGSTSTQNT